MRRRILAGERCGMLFGRERNGLTSDEVANADAVVMIPVNSSFASLNLAQAVLILGYEWLRQTGAATLGRVTTYEEPVAEGLRIKKGRPASKEELTGFFEHLEGELDKHGFLFPPHKRPTMIRNIRTMFSRMGATEQEVRTLRGIVAALTKGKGAGRKVP
jgi:tRNA/rRNA methyltransferase